MNEYQQFEKDGFAFEINSDKSDTVTIINSAPGVFGHCVQYYKNNPERTNEKVKCIPESVIDKTGRKYLVTSIDHGVFDLLTDVEEFYIPSSIKNIVWSFWKCHNLKKIHVSRDNQNYEDVDGVLYSKGLKRLVAFPCNYANSYEVIDGVDEIANMAFKSSRSIVEIKFPSSLRKIGTNVFYGCINLENVYGIPDEVKVSKKNSSNKPLKAIFHYKNKEWSLKEIVQEFNAND